MAAFPLIVFDVNETLLDLRTIEPIFQRIFGEKDAMRLWFANLVMYSVVLTLAGSYVPFTDIGSAVMKMLADARGIRIRDEDKTELTDKFSTMPPYPDGLAMIFWRSARSRRSSATTSTTSLIS
jgi:2-haloacid dehalogenase